MVLFPKQYFWSILFNSLEQFSPDFMDERRQPEIQDQENIFE